MLSAMMLADQLGAALHRQRSKLTYVGPKVHGAREELLIELQLSEF
jgi:hypothetical protein